MRATYGNPARFEKMSVGGPDKPGHDVLSYAPVDTSCRTLFLAMIPTSFLLRLAW
jgi:hypothetical protein